VFGSLTLAYEHKHNGWLVSPYAGYEGSRSKLDAYSENGAGVSNLRFGEQQVITSSALIGLRLEKKIARPGARSHPRVGSSIPTISMARAGLIWAMPISATTFHILWMPICSARTTSRWV
jgi:hypothetical protein